MKRLIAAAIGTLGCASALVACSSGGHTASPASSVATGGGTQVKVGGTDLPGLADSGLWTTGPTDEPLAATPLAAVLEVSGAVLSWTVDDPPADTATHITFTDLARADWLWRIVGESGHIAVTSALGALAADLAAVDRAADQPPSIELAGVDIVPGSVDPLRRLAMGHWLRRWWPASRREGIAGLDRALLDVEVALLTVGAQGFFTDDTLDSDVTELLVPHAPALITHVRGGDPRVLVWCGPVPGWPRNSASRAWMKPDGRNCMPLWMIRARAWPGSRHRRADIVTTTRWAPA